MNLLNLLKQRSHLKKEVIKIIKSKENFSISNLI